MVFVSVVICIFCSEVIVYFFFFFGVSFKFLNNPFFKLWSISFEHRYRNPTRISWIMYSKMSRATLPHYNYNSLNPEHPMYKQPECVNKCIFYAAWDPNYYSLRRWTHLSAESPEYRPSRVSTTLYKHHFFSPVSFWKCLFSVKKDNISFSWHLRFFFQI